VPVAAAASHGLLRPANDDPNNQLVGIEGQVDTLAEMVKAVSEKDGVADMRLKVFAIVGFGGLGKTTLAMEVCRQLEAEFQHQAQVSVSQAFDGTKDLKGLLRRVLQQIVNPTVHGGHGIREENSLGNMDSMDEDALASKLEGALKNKRYPSHS
jgi:disease resistance protein RPM1